MAFEYITDTDGKAVPLQDVPRVPAPGPVGPVPDPAPLQPISGLPATPGIAEPHVIDKATDAIKRIDISQATWVLGAVVAGHMFGLVKGLAVVGGAAYLYDQLKQGNQ